MAQWAKLQFAMSACRSNATLSLGYIASDPVFVMAQVSESLPSEWDSQKEFLARGVDLGQP